LCGTLPVKRSERRSEECVERQTVYSTIVKKAAQSAAMDEDFFIERMIEDYIF